jgi:hypothetical protein
MLVKDRTAKFDENPSSGSLVSTCGHEEGSAVNSEVSVYILTCVYPLVGLQMRAFRVHLRTTCNQMT